MNKLAEKMRSVRQAVEPLIGVKLDVLRIPRRALEEFEPSQVGTVVGTLVDACVPALEDLYPDLKGLGLKKAPGILGDREGYPDFVHKLGVRLELKMLYVDPVGVNMKSPPTPREPSARITQKVTLKNVAPEKDLLFLLAYQLQASKREPNVFSPVFIDVGLFPMIECVKARDHRLIESGGRWFGDFETPAILSTKGRLRRASGKSPRSTYGRKESEGKDYNEDTNFGKLKRIPYKPLQQFLKNHGCAYMTRGSYPKIWSL